MQAILSIEQDRLLAKAMRKQQKKARRLAEEKLQQQLFEYAVLSDMWTQEQQTALKAALLQFPSSMEKAERWTKVAEQVEGKTKQQCLAWYKYLKDYVAKQKISATASS